METVITTGLSIFVKFSRPQSVVSIHVHHTEMMDVSLGAIIKFLLKANIRVRNNYLNYRSVQVVTC